MKILKSILFLFLISGISLSAQTLEPTANMALMNVIVTNKGGKPLDGEIVSFVSSKDKKVYKGNTKADGKFSILIPIGDVYEVSYKNFTEDITYNKIEIPAEPALYTWDVSIIFEPGRVIILENVEYDFDKASLRPSSFNTLNDLVEVMKIKDKLEIEIGGHTDSKGKEDYNIKLSQARAESVRNYLISKGIKANRITAKGYGMSQPIAPNTNSDGSDNPDGRQKNRRTEVKVTKEQ
jgi:OOP family OmpA-OmpF porin